MANAQANASAGGSPAKYEVRMKGKKTMSMGYSKKSMKKTYSNSIRAGNVKRVKKGSHNPY